MDLIQKELDQIRREWNAHPIRPSKTSDSPSGHPNMLYFMPEILGKIQNFFTLFHATLVNAGVEDYVCPLDCRDLHTVSEYASLPDPPGSLEFLEMSNSLWMKITVLCQKVWRMLLNFMYF